MLFGITLVAYLNGKRWTKLVKIKILTTFGDGRRVDPYIFDEQFDQASILFVSFFRFEFGQASTQNAHKKRFITKIDDTVGLHPRQVSIPGVKRITSRVSFDCRNMFFRLLDEKFLGGTRLAHFYKFSVRHNVTHFTVHRSLIFRIQIGNLQFFFQIKGSHSWLNNPNTDRRRVLSARI